MEFNVIKENDLFYLSNPRGDVPVDNTFGHGLYTKDTRVLSQLEFQVSPNMLLELKADDSGNYEAVYEYTNQEVQRDDEFIIRRETLKLRRRQFVDGTRLYEEVTVNNYDQHDAQFDLRYNLGADFRDMFEVRGFTRNEERGSCEVDAGDTWLRFRHRAVDGLMSETTVRLIVEDGMAVTVLDSSLNARVDVPGHGQVRCLLVVEPTIGSAGSLFAISQNVLEVDYENAVTSISNNYADWLQTVPVVDGSVAFKRWYDRGLRDIRMLLTDIGQGYFPVAGVPWFAVPFGRDSLITALQMLAVDPKAAKGTLRTMAAYQGTKVDPTRDEQPGKIMHELRAGELTRTGEVPFGPYYGTIDATALFLNLAADYYAWTGDRDLLEELLPNVLRAFHWIEHYGDRDGDGFVEYFQEASKGLGNQGWKDSGDSSVHKDGTLAKAPIALCEVQGYSYRAYRRWAELFMVLGNEQKMEEFTLKAHQLREQFVKFFWIDEESNVALALDGEKNQVASASSNMGQVLWSGILPHHLALRLKDRLLQPDLFNGFGIRTLAATEKAYNPLSYHNGSIWPHDNSIIVAGMHAYGFTDAVERVSTALLGAASAFRHMRLPELFSGFGNDEVDEPLPYPVSCSPQAWAAATPAMVLQSILGIEPRIVDTAIRLNPVLPTTMDQLTITGIHIGDGSLDISLHRTANGATAVSVSRNTTGRPLVLGTQ